MTEKYIYIITIEKSVFNYIYITLYKSQLKYNDILYLYLLYL